MKYAVLLMWLVAGVACSNTPKKVSESDVLRATGQAEDADMGYSLKGDARIESLLQQQARREDNLAARNNRLSRLESSYSDTGASVRTPAQGPSVEEGVATRRDSVTE